MDELNDLQMAIMVFIKEWVDTKKIPVPQPEIIKSLQKFGIKSYTTLNGIQSLIIKGFIRKGYSPIQNRSVYVQIRNITVPTDYHFDVKKWNPRHQASL